MPDPFIDGLAEAMQDLVNQDVTPEEERERSARLMALLEGRQESSQGRHRNVILESALHWSDEMVLGAALVILMLQANRAQIARSAAEIQSASGAFGIEIDDDPTVIATALSELLALCDGWYEAIQDPGLAERQEAAEVQLHERGFHGIPPATRVVHEAENLVESEATIREILVTMFGAERAETLLALREEGTQS